MIASASRFGMGVVLFSSPLRGYGVIANPDAGLDTIRHIESFCMAPLGAGVLPLRVPSVVVGVKIDRRCVLYGVAVTH
jgi:hypothetical protein